MNAPRLQRPSTRNAAVAIALFQRRSVFVSITWPPSRDFDGAVTRDFVE
jgi:hypothetical protein